MSTYDSMNFYRNLKFEERDYLNSVLNSLSLYIFLDSYIQSITDTELIY